MRRHADEQFVIDTPSARAKYDIPPGAYRTPPDVTRPGHRGVRLVQLQRIRVSNIDTMMRMMPYYFRSEEAAGLDFTCQFELTGPGGGAWVLRVADQRCNVRPGVAERPDLLVRCEGRVFLGVHRGELNAVWQLLTGGIRLRGRRGLFLTFPRLFPVYPKGSMLARWLWALRRTRRTPPRS